MAVRTETRRENPPSETLNVQPQVAPQQPLFVGLPGAFPSQAFGPFGYAPLGAPFAGPFTLPYAFGPQGFAGQAFAPWLPLAAQQGIAHAALHSLPPLAAPGAVATGASIPVAVQDLGREVVATFEVPGIAPADLNIVVGTTSVALRTLRPAANGRVYQGTFTLPAEVLPSQASARLENGLLVVTLPRRTPTEEPRRLEIEA